MRYRKPRKSTAEKAEEKARKIAANAARKAERSERQTLGTAARANQRAIVGALGISAGVLARFADYMRHGVTFASGGGYGAAIDALMPKFAGFDAIGSAVWSPGAEAIYQGSARYHDQLSAAEASGEPIAWVRHFAEGDRVDLHHLGYGGRVPAYALVRIDSRERFGPRELELRHYHPAGESLDAGGFAHSVVYTAAMLDPKEPMQREMRNLCDAIYAQKDPAGIGKTLAGAPQTAAIMRAYSATRQGLAGA